MSKKILFIILSGFLLIVIAVIVLISHLKSTDNNQVACTMEAKICPDGSAVGRSGPNCEFTPCP